MYWRAKSRTLTAVTARGSPQSSGVCVCCNFGVSFHATMHRRLFSAASALRSPAPTVVCGMSGGVDSSVSALLLQRAGWSVIGAFMRNWDAADEAGGGSSCGATEDYNAAARVCAQLGIPLHRLDFSAAYWNAVFTPFLEAYAAGLTPHPDVDCNRLIKFGAFRDAAAGLAAASAAGRGWRGSGRQGVSDAGSASSGSFVGTGLGGGGGSFRAATFFATGHYAQLWPPVPMNLPSLMDRVGEDDGVSVIAAVSAAGGGGLRRLRGEVAGRPGASNHTGSYRKLVEPSGRDTTITADIYSSCDVGMLARLIQYLPIEHLGDLVPPSTSSSSAFAASDQLQTLAAQPPFGTPLRPLPSLLSSVDRVKDQSDFLAAVPGSALRRVLFPVGGLPKSAVRAIAAEGEAG